MQLNVLDDLAEAMILVCLWRLRDGLLDCVQVLYQFTLEAPQSADGHVYALINTFLQHAIERVERPGGSHEGVGRKKRPGGSHEGVGRKKIKELHLGLKVDLSQRGWSRQCTMASGERKSNPATPKRKWESGLYAQPGLRMKPLPKLLPNLCTDYALSSRKTCYPSATAQNSKPQQRLPSEASSHLKHGTAIARTSTSKQ